MTNDEAERGPTTALGRQYPTRKCGYCPEKIPKQQADGTYYFYSKYKQLATCGSDECQRLAHSSNMSAEEEAKSNAAMDLFLRGGKANERE